MRWWRAGQQEGVRGTPLCHAFLSRTLLLLPTRLPPSDASSAFRCVFRPQMCLPLRNSSSASRPVSRTASHHGPIFRLPSHSIPWLLGLPPPSRDIPQCLARSAQHPPWHPPHRYVFCYTAACSGHTTSLPPLCRILWLHHCVSRHSAMPSSCSALLTRCAMSCDAVPPTRYRLRPAI